jgi:hypothetical protein
MATLSQKIECEAKARTMLEDAGVPEPDWIEYGYGCIGLFFNDPKVVLIIDIDDYSEVDARRGPEPGVIDLRTSDPEVSMHDGAHRDDE